MTGKHYTSHGGRVFAAVLMLVCLAIAVVAILLAVDTFTTGVATVRLRSGGQIHLNGAWAYVYALNGLLFCLTMSQFRLGRCNRSARATTQGGRKASR